MEKEKPTDPDSTEKKEDLTDKMVDKIKWWNRAATINADDPFWVGVIKIGIRIIGILIMLALSPFIAIGLFLAFVAAG